METLTGRKDVLKCIIDEALYTLIPLVHAIVLRRRQWLLGVDESTQIGNDEGVVGLSIDIDGEGEVTEG